MTKYGLNIVFRMKTYPQFLFEGESNDFEYGGLNFKLTKLSDLVGSYSLMIKPVEDMDHAKYLLNYIKFALTLFVLQYNWVAVEIDEDIKTANIFDEETCLINGKICSGEYDINRTTLFPVIPNLFIVQSHHLSFKNKLNINDLEENINYAFSLDYEKIYEDEKLSLALEIWQCCIPAGIVLFCTLKIVFLKNY